MAVEQRPGVLVVDDDAALRALLVDALADEGYEARAVEGGGTALSLLRQWTPGVIVLDLRLRDMDGAALLTALRAGDFGAIPVVVLTARAMTDLEAARLDSPVLTKPFNLDELFETVARLVHGVPSALPCVMAGEV